MHGLSTLVLTLNPAAETTHFFAPCLVVLVVAAHEVADLVSERGGGEVVVAVDADPAGILARRIVGVGRVALCDSITTNAAAEADALNRGVFE